MNITCEHCGSSIDIEKNKVCPTCKAPYKNNKMYKEYLEHEKKERELNLESKSLDLEMKKNITKGVKVVGKVTMISFILPFIIFIVIAVACFVIFTNVEDSNNNETLDEFFTENKIDDVVVNINETADNGRYSVTCDQYLINELYSYSGREETPDDGFKYVTIHLILNNYNNYDMYFTEDVNLTVDGLAQKSITDFKRDELPFHISGNLKVEGYYTFQVNEDVKEYNIKVGNDITINIIEGN